MQDVVYMVSRRSKGKRVDSPLAEVPAGFALMSANASAMWALDGANGSGNGCAFGGIVPVGVSQRSANAQGKQG